MWAIILAPAVATLLFHLILSAVQPYGYFRDEFYYIACSQKLAWGYVDHPPLLPLLTRVVTTVLGDSIVALHLLPAVAIAAFVAIGPIMAREFGGGRRAIAIAAAASAVPVMYLIYGGMLSPVALDHLIWALSALCLLRLLKTEDPRYWIPIGVLVGIGLENKHNAAFLAAAIAVGTLATSSRKYLRSPHLWAGTGLALLIALPQLLWQIGHGWPTLEFARNAASEKNAVGTLVDLPLLQVFGMNPLTFPIWITGLWWTLFSRDGKRYRMLGLLWVVPFLLFLVQGGSQPHYLSPAYPALLAGGAVAIAGWRPFARGVWAPGATVLALLAGGLAFLPLGATVLPVAQAESYVRALGLDEMEMEEGKTSVLPQWQADRFGWEEMTARVAEAYRSLPAEEQARATIITENYGEAGAINFFGDRYGLPEPISGHNNYYLWGPGETTTGIVISVGLDEDFLRQHFASIELASVFTCEHCTSDENGSPIYLLREPRQPLQDMWADFKHYG